MAPSPHADGDIPKMLVREQLARIISSAALSRSERLSAFLRFVVEESLAGRGETLKEQVIAAALYGDRPDSGAVRADARRLRDKLREYYESAPSDPVSISLPKGTYAPAIAFIAQSSDDVQPALTTSQKSFRPWLYGVCGLSLMSAVVIFAPAHREPQLPPEIRVLTQYPGGESDPTFSPDGNFFAFARWDPPGPSAQDIWVKDIHSEALRQITNTPHPVAEHSPAWSPDGRQIVFQRVGWQRAKIPNAGIYVASALGGDERRIAEEGWSPRWSADGRSILILSSDLKSIVQIDVASLHRRELLRVSNGRRIDAFALSPDGRRVATVQSEPPGSADIYTNLADGSGLLRITDWNSPIEGVAWTADGRELIFDVSGRSLWRAPALANKPSKGQPVTGLEGFVSAAARAVKPVIWKDRLSFQVQKAAVSLRLINLDTFTAAPIAASSRVDLPGPFYPDGSRIAFSSQWAGLPAPLWIVNRDGSNLRRLAVGQTQAARPAGWSPDGTMLTLEGIADGKPQIFVIGEAGGEAKPIASGITPSWSQDGRWIYYASIDSEIWKIPASGGTPIRIAGANGREPRESMDGKMLFFVGRDGKTLNAVGGSVPGVEVRPGLWDVTDAGVLFARLGQEQDEVFLYRSADLTIHRIGALPFKVARQFASVTFSRDGRWALANQVDGRQSDLMVIDRFH